ncbi:hypothetical protein M6B38_330870 [Iris pallida]|uniref:Uncharacterized protein n=1 Tax=Iris pallida TaxID=29817 RepID=A0AAX6H2Z2_IRIPA|nr:hypothetical protein M6B38_330870 [Iris pallida]
MYSCTHPSRSHRLVVFQILCTCHVLYFRFIVIFLYFTFLYLFPILYIPVLSCSFPVFHISCSPVLISIS